MFPWLIHQSSDVLPSPLTKMFPWPIHPSPCLMHVLHRML
jgi:hypothetical protein